jgi:hypothetical protein
LARAAHEAGAHVQLVAGPVSLPTPYGVARTDVRSALEMHAAVMAQVDSADVFIATALAAGLPYLVSGDKDLLESPLPPGFGVLTPAQALQHCIA